MRVIRITLAGLGLAVVATGVTGSVLGVTRSSAFAKGERALEARWQQVTHEGVAPAQLNSLRGRLEASPFHGAGWLSPVWWTQTGQALIDSLSQGTDSVWSSDLSNARGLAEQAVQGWAQLQAQLGPFLPSDAAAAARQWPTQIAAATTPAQLTAYASSWSAALTSARRVAQRAQLDAQVARFGGVQGLLQQAQRAEQTARSLNLDDENVGALSAAVRTQVAADQDASASLSQLVNALAAFRQLLALNNNVAGTLRPILLSVDQAAAEGTPDGAAFVKQYSALQAALTAARQASQLTTVAQQLAALQASVAAELSNDKCGHRVPVGKVITVNLTLQEAIFYQDGCVMQATPVTTGRALLRTPTGTFHIFNKQSPFQFISPWPITSPFYYYPSWVKWVMEFAGGGYFLHDAPWEPSWQYGPGSEDSSGASHGCIHIPTPVMQWAYQWTPPGTPVLISY
jgi:lipoprotein-anchoring transpeptidase ErfK/SrfK